MADLTLEHALPVIRDLAARKANFFVRRFGLAADDGEDVGSQLVLSLLGRWPQFDSDRASVQTFASRVMDRALVSILRSRLAPSRVEQQYPTPDAGPSAALRGDFRIDLERSLAGLPAAVQATAIALSWYSTVEVAEELGCSRQVVQLRKRQIRAAMTGAGIGPDYFANGGPR